MTKIQTLTQPEMTELKVLLALLRLRRPHETGNEMLARKIVEQCISEVDTPLTYTTDRHGNLIVKVGEDTGVVFTAHLDTVHRTEGINNITLVKPTNNQRWLVADDSITGLPDVLGADDAAGVFLLTELIKAGVQGTYLFFVGEEVGGVGSSAFVQDNPNFSANMAVAFDRRGYSDVITHQGVGARTASDEFGMALASALNEQNPKFEYKASDRGVYTDTKEFAGIVPECTNISVGYFNEHTNREELDLNHLLALRDAVLAIDWKALPVKRIPTPEVDYWTGNWMYGHGEKYAIAPVAEYTSLCDRATELLNKHFDELPPAVTSFLREIEDLYDS